MLARSKDSTASLLRRSGYGTTTRPALMRGEHLCDDHVRGSVEACQRSCGHHATFEGNSCLGDAGREWRIGGDLTVNLLPAARWPKGRDTQGRVLRTRRCKRRNEPTKERPLRLYPHSILLF